MRIQKLRLLSINSMGATRQTIAPGQFIQYRLHIDAEVAERELAAFGRASGAQLLQVVFVLAILVVDHGPHEQQETPGEVPHGSIAPPATFDHPSTSQADPRQQSEQRHLDVGELNKSL